MMLPKERERERNVNYTNDDLNEVNGNDIGIWLTNESRSYT